MFSQNCMELSASSALFFDEIKIFRQMATSIIFYFHRKFWIFKFRLVSVQISIFFVKTMHYKFQTHFFRPSVSPRGSKFRTINWGTSRLPSSDRGVATDSSIMGKIWNWRKMQLEQTRSKFSDPKDVFKGHWCPAVYEYKTKVLATHFTTYYQNWN